MTFDNLRNMPAPFVRLAAGELGLIAYWYAETDAVGVKAPNGRLHVVPAGRLEPGQGCAVEAPVPPPSLRTPWRGDGGSNSATS